MKISPSAWKMKARETLNVRISRCNDIKSLKVKKHYTVLVNFMWWIIIYLELCSSFNFKPQKFL